MSLLRANGYRVIVSKSGVLTDASEAARTWAAPTIEADLGASDFIYLGRRHAFNNVYLSVATGNTAGSKLKLEAWDGRAWVEVESVLDETDAFKQSGFICWPEGDENYRWQIEDSDKIAGLETAGIKTEMFWLRLSVDVAASAGTALQAVKTLFSDDRLMQTIHPEIMNYLPAGQSNFLPQHELAKDALVTQLRIKGLISYEEQIRNPDDWVLPATYKCIELILAPIPGDERLDRVKKEMALNASSSLVMASATLDSDKSEHVEPKEQDKPSTSWGSR